MRPAVVAGLMLLASDGLDLYLGEWSGPSCGMESQITCTLMAELP